jgi:multidrug efflux system membrane fusion protein
MKTVPDQLNEIGSVEAYATVNIKSRVEGHLVAIDFKEGQFVTKGQLLFTLDQAPPRAALQQAQANLDKDAAQARQAVTDEHRYAFLLQQGVGSREQYDQAKATAGEDTAAVAADRAAIEQARLNLQFTEIRAPIDGQTGNLQSHIGDLIKPDADNPMVTITQIQPIYVDFSIPERELASVRQHLQQATLEVDATIPNSQTPPEHGVLSFINNTVDTTTGTILLKGLFQNENRYLWPGSFVNVTLTIDRRDALVVPSSAVQTNQQGAYVFVIQPDMKVRMQPVSAGSQLGTERVIDRGLNPGETVVTDGQLRLVPGASVVVKQSL